MEISLNKNDTSDNGCTYGRFCNAHFDNNYELYEMKRCCFDNYLENKNFIF